MRDLITHEQPEFSSQLKSIGLLLLVGALFGLCVPLSKLLVGLEAHPIGLTFWVNLFIACIALTVSLPRCRLPVFNRRNMQFIVIWGLLGAIPGELLIFWTALYLPSSTLSVILVCEGFMVYAWMCAIGKEKTGVKRFIGLLLGLIGILLLLLGESMSFTGSETAWILLALLIPASFAAEDILLAHTMPRGIDFLAGTGLSALMASALLLPVAVLSNDFIPLHTMLTLTGIVVVVLALVTFIAIVLSVQLLWSSGAVFGSQVGHAVTIAGIVWAIVLFGERPTASLWIACGLLLCGLWLVHLDHPMRKR